MLRGTEAQRSEVTQPVSGEAKPSDFKGCTPVPESSIRGLGLRAREARLGQGRGEPPYCRAGILLGGLSPLGMLNITALTVKITEKKNK